MSLERHPMVEAWSPGAGAGRIRPSFADYVAGGVEGADGTARAGGADPKSSPTRSYLKII